MLTSLPVVGVAPLLYTVGGLLMTVTAGGRCVDVAVSATQDPANLRRLSNTLLRLVGLGFYRRVSYHDDTTRGGVSQADVKAKHRVNFLFFTDSFSSLLLMARTTPLGTCDVDAFRWFPAEEWSSLKCISRRIYYVFVCGARSRLVLTLRVGDGRSELKTCRPADRLQWLMDFSRGDVIFLFLAAPAGPIRAGCATEEPRSLTLGLSALCALFLWMLRPYIAFCAVICLGWTTLRHLHRALQKRSD